MQITQETIKATRQWYIDNRQACIDEAVSGEVKVNDLPSYINEMEQDKRDVGCGKWDHTLSFRQMATYIQTGECHPILP